MKNYTILVIILITLVLGGFSFPQETHASESVCHVVRPGETVSQIAAYYGVSVSAIVQANNLWNPNLIYTGQCLLIPLYSRPSPPCTTIHVVRRGEYLKIIAARYGVSVSAIVQANGLKNPNLIYVGQKIKVPQGTGVIVPTATPVPGEPTPTPLPQQNVGFAFGIQVHLPGQNMGAVADQAKDLGMAWVKQQIEWKVYESAGRGQIDWTPLDEMVTALNSAGLNILFSVVKAPAWARSTTDEDGPPADAQPVTGRFLPFLAISYHYSRTCRASCETTLGAARAG